MIAYIEDDVVLSNNVTLGGNVYVMKNAQFRYLIQ